MGYAHIISSHNSISLKKLTMLIFDWRSGYNASLYIIIFCGMWCRNEISRVSEI